MNHATGMLVILVLLLGGAERAKGDLVSSLPNGTTVPMPDVKYYGPGPQCFGPPAITWTSTGTSSDGGPVFGYVGEYGFVDNGQWDSAVGPIAAVNAPIDTMTFAFSTPVGAVGGYLNYVPGGSIPTTIAVYDANHDPIESSNLTFCTGGGTDTGRFLAFQEPTADISYFTLSDNFVAIAALTIGGPSNCSPSSVPEPSRVAALLGLAGMGLIGLVWRRRRRAG